MFTTFVSQRIKSSPCYFWSFVMKQNEFFTKPCFLFSGWKTPNLTMLQRSDVLLNCNTVYVDNHTFILIKKI